MTTLNKHERIIANAESVKKSIQMAIDKINEIGYAFNTCQHLRASIEKLNAIIEIMEK